MYKTIGVMRKLDSLSHDEFAAFWMDEFAPVARRLRNLRGYVVNVVPSGAADSRVDGFAELWFDSKEDFDVAFGELAEEFKALRPRFVSELVIHPVIETIVSAPPWAAVAGAQ